MRSRHCAIPAPRPCFDRSRFCNCVNVRCRPWFERSATCFDVRSKAVIFAGRDVALISPPLLAVAFALQYLGLLAERWLFFAQAKHAQSLYYQAIS